MKKDFAALAAIIVVLVGCNNPFSGDGSSSRPASGVTGTRIAGSVSTTFTQAFGSPGEHTAVPSFVDGTRTPFPNNPLARSTRNSQGYTEYLPPNYVEDGVTLFPLIIQLHGRGGGGNGMPAGQTYLHTDGKTEDGFLDGTNSRGARVGVARQLLARALRDNSLETDAIVLAPQLFRYPSRNSSALWGTGTIEFVMERFASHYPVDRTRIYVVGFSGGANGIEEYMRTYETRGTPEETVPAAYVIVAPTVNRIRGTTGRFDFFQDVGLWFIAGEEDGNFAYQKSIEAAGYVVNDIGSGVFRGRRTDQTDPIEHYRFLDDGSRTWVRTAVIDISGGAANTFSNTMVTSSNGVGHSPVIRDPDTNRTVNPFGDPRVLEWLYSFSRSTSQ